ncbi:universal stress protein [Methylibium sp.]|uniref:universal stress protein n=1 Tax=Methylibium sp. TaxID=2067992 RepID=UPI003D130A32
MFKHILVPVDGGALADRAMQASIDFALQLGASITAFIAEPPVPPAGSTRSAAHYLRDLEAHARATAEHAKGVLSAFERRATDAGVPFEGFFAQAHEIDAAIADVARQRGCDLIVMVTHGRGLFGEWLFGSQTRGVMVRSELPLLMLH